MSDLVVAILDNAVKVLGSFALGFFVRDIVDRKRGNNCSPKPFLSRVSKPKEELKMVLCVNQALKMGTGKVGAQCAHAALGVVKQYYVSHNTAIRQWEFLGQCKVTLRVNNDDDMEKLAKIAKSKNVPSYIVRDAGRTQIPCGSKTVLAIGPASKSEIDAITGHLKLL